MVVTTTTGAAGWRAVTATDRDTDTGETEPETGDGVSRSHEGGGNVSTTRSKDQIAARWAEM